ncbi:MAG TPA: YebC/PmpR family DNA-binding transcriptional regulator [Candidatus Kapabacteria bacterium]|nr:YebC/PmpR family DNA-binding transcriptional regulator [Candidatus Kapabacteria bacterium]HPO61529.1 YebC/PmpR family DNA-binding transcriptional regulator [Candidatus Kapabacteria bacterium]
MSGHSKWANIKHKKAAKDAKRGKIFTRLAKEITIAAREGGGDVDANPRLRLAVLNAKAENVPADNIKRAIQKGTGEIEGAVYEEIVYEGYAPFGVAIILETVTDNRNRTFPEIRSQFGKLGGSIGEPGSVAWNFDRKGVIKIKTNGKSEDDLMEIVMESGAEDLEFDEEVSRIITDFESLTTVYKFCEDKKLDIAESKFEYIPKNTIMIESINDARKVMKFIDNIEDLDDVQNIFANNEFPDEIMEQLENEG